MVVQLARTRDSRHYEDLDGLSISTIARVLVVLDRFEEAAELTRGNKQVSRRAIVHRAATRDRERIARLMAAMEPEERRWGEVRSRARILVFDHGAKRPEEVAPMSHDCFMIRKSLGLESGVYRPKEERVGWPSLDRFSEFHHYLECEICGERPPSEDTVRTLEHHLSTCPGCVALVPEMDCDVADEVNSLVAAGQDPGLPHRLAASRHRFTCVRHEGARARLQPTFCSWAAPESALEAIQQAPRPEDPVELADMVLRGSLALEACQKEFESGRFMARFLDGEDVGPLLEALNDPRVRLTATLLLAEASLSLGRVADGLDYARQALDQCSSEPTSSAPPLEDLLRLLTPHDVALAVELAKCCDSRHGVERDGLVAIAETLIDAGRVEEALTRRDLPHPFGRAAVKDRTAVAVVVAGMQLHKRGQAVQALISRDLSLGDSSTLELYEAELPKFDWLSHEWEALLRSCSTPGLRRRVWKLAFRALCRQVQTEDLGAGARRVIGIWLLTLVDVALDLKDDRVAGGLARMAGSNLLQYGRPSADLKNLDEEHLKLLAKTYACLIATTGRLPGWWPRSRDLVAAVREALLRVREFQWFRHRHALPGGFENKEILLPDVERLLLEGRLDDAWAAASRGDRPNEIEWKFWRMWRYLASTASVVRVAIRVCDWERALRWMPHVFDETGSWRRAERCVRNELLWDLGELLVQVGREEQAWRIQEDPYQRNRWVLRHRPQGAFRAVRVSLGRGETWFCLRRMAPLGVPAPAPGDVARRLRDRAEDTGYRRFNPSGGVDPKERPADRVAALAEEGLVQEALEAWSGLATQIQEARTTRHFRPDLESDRVNYARASLVRALALANRAGEAHEVARCTLTGAPDDTQFRPVLMELADHARATGCLGLLLGRDATSRRAEDAELVARALAHRGASPDVLGELLPLLRTPEQLRVWVAAHALAALNGLPDEESRTALRRRFVEMLRRVETVAPELAVPAQSPRV